VLASWNDGAARRAIVDFVARITTEGGPDFVPAPERIAVFDNDGTLWCEQPMYTQAMFAIDRIRKLADDDPAIATRFQGILQRGLPAVAELSAEGRGELVAVTHAGMTPEQFDGIVRQWLATAMHPRFQRPYRELVYQPMVELLTFLRGHGFKTFIVSGGGVEFMRAYAETAYGVPPEQVIGSTIAMRFEVRNGVPTILREERITFVDDKDGKPVGIQNHIGRRPILAVGNSDGDLQMLQWTTGGTGARLGLLVHHTDAKREYAYDRDSTVGQLRQAMDEAPQHGWLLIDMATDWKTVFAPERTQQPAPAVKATRPGD
jgi:phosphoserine phosphatase